MNPQHASTSSATASQDPNKRRFSYTLLFHRHKPKLIGPSTSIVGNNWCHQKQVEETSSLVLHNSLDMGDLVSPPGPTQSAAHPPTTGSSTSNRSSLGEYAHFEDNSRSPSVTDDVHTNGSRKSSQEVSSGLGSTSTYSSCSVVQQKRRQFRLPGLSHQRSQSSLNETEPTQKSRYPSSPKQTSPQPVMSNSPVASQLAPTPANTVRLTPQHHSSSFVPLESSGCKSTFISIPDSLPMHSGGTEHIYSKQARSKFSLRKFSQQQDSSSIARQSPSHRRQLQDEKAAAARRKDSTESGTEACPSAKGRRNRRFTFHQQTAAPSILLSPEEELDIQKNEGGGPSSDPSQATSSTQQQPQAKKRPQDVEKWYLQKFLQGHCSGRRNALSEQQLGVPPDILKEKLELIAISEALDTCF